MGGDTLEFSFSYNHLESITEWPKWIEDFTVQIILQLWKKLIGGQVAIISAKSDVCSMQRKRQKKEFQAMRTRSPVVT